MWWRECSNRGWYDWLRLTRRASSIAWLKVSPISSLGMKRCAFWRRGDLILNFANIVVSDSEMIISITSSRLSTTKRRVC